MLGEVTEKTLGELWDVMNNHTQNDMVDLEQISVSDIALPSLDYCGDGCGLLWLGDGVGTATVSDG